MASKRSIRRSRRCYRALLRLYPMGYRERFAEPMEVTFNDLLHERAKKGKNLAGFVLGVFLETSLTVIREHIVAIVGRKKILHVTLITACSLTLPLGGNVVCDEFNWTILDFAVWGALVFGTGFAYQALTSKPAGIAYRAATGLAVMTAFLLAWVNLAVDIIGDGPVNLLYFAVPLIGFVGAVMARLKPRGMSLALFATALAMAFVPFIALMLGTSDFRPGVLPVFIINSVFVALFAGSAMLFRRAGVAPET